MGFKLENVMISGLLKRCLLRKSGIWGLLLMRVSSGTSVVLTNCHFIVTLLSVGPAQQRSCSTVAFSLFFSPDLL